MIVGVGRIELALPGVTSLKAKRSIVKRVIDRTANRFNVAVSEVALQDSHRQAVIGVAVVSSESRHANQMLDHIADFIRGVSEAVVTDVRVELVPMGSVVGESCFQEGEFDGLC